VWLTAITDNCFHYIHTRHSSCSVELPDLLLVGVVKEVVQVVLGAALVRVPHVGVFV